MALQRSSGTTALEMLREYFEDDLTCPKCGYDDRADEWDVTTHGGVVRYRHTCPSCGAVNTRSVRRG